MSTLSTLMGSGAAAPDWRTSLRAYYNDAHPRAESPAESKPKKKHHRGLFGGGFLSDVLDAVSLPLSTVTSAAKEVGDIVDVATGYHWNPKGAPKQHPSLGDFWQQIVNPERQIHGGDILRGNPEKGIAQGVLSRPGQKGALPFQPPSPVTTGLGIGLDVGLDPLSYVTGAGLVRGSKGAAEHIAQQAAKDISEVSGRKITEDAAMQILRGEGKDLAAQSPEIAARIEEIRSAAEDAVYAARRGGPSALTDAQIEQFGGGRLKKGLQFHLPGVGGVPITTGNGPLSEISTFKHGLSSKIGDILLGEGGKPASFGKIVANAENAARARSGSPAEMLRAIGEIRTRATGSNLTEAATKDAANILNKALGKHTAEEIQWARDAINGDPEGLANAPQALVEGLSRAFEKHGGMLVKDKVLKPEQLMKFDKYFPSPIEADAREAIQVAGLAPAREDAPIAARSFVENRRKLWDPETGEGGIGHDLVDETTGEVISRRIPFQAATRKEAEQKASAILADELEAAAARGEETAVQFLTDHPDMVERLKEGTYPLFQEPREALVAQTRAIGRRIGQAHMGRKLYEAGAKGGTAEHPLFSILDPRRMGGAEPIVEQDYLKGQAEKFGELAQDRGAAAREMQLSANELAQERPSPVTPLEGVLGPSTPEVAPGATQSPLSGVASAGAEPAAPEALTHLQGLHAEAQQILDEVPVTWGGKPASATTKAEDVVAPGGQRRLREIATEMGIDVKQFTGTEPEIMAGIRHAVEEEVARAAGYNDFLEYAIDHEVRAAESAQQAAARYEKFPNAEADFTESYSQRVTSGETRKLQRRASNAANQFLKPREEARRALADAEAELAQLEAKGAEVVSTELSPKVAEQLQKLRTEKEQLEKFLDPTGVKARMDLQSAADEAQYRSVVAGDEALIPGADIQGPQDLAALRDPEAAVLRGQEPTVSPEIPQRADLTDELGQDPNTLVDRGRTVIDPEDQAVNDAMAARLDRVNRDLARLEDRLNLERPRSPLEKVAPVTDVDIARAKVEGLQASIDDYTRQIEEARTATVQSFGADKAALGGTVDEVKTLPMNFAYGANARPGITSSTTFDAIAAGERTSTTRFGRYARDLVNDFQVGDAVDVVAKDGRKLRVVVDSVRPINPSEVTDQFLEDWSRAEGWSVEYGRDAFATKGQSGAAQMTYHIEGASDVAARAAREVPMPRKIRRVNPGSATDEAIGEAEARIRQLNERPVEPFKQSEFAKQPFDIEEGKSAGRGLREASQGLLKEAAQSTVGGRQIAQRAEFLRASWKDLGETATTHEEAARAFRQYKAELDKVMPPSTERDAVALAETQVDQVGLMANDPSAIDTAADQIDRKIEIAKHGTVDPGYIEFVSKVQDDTRRWRIIAKEAERVGDENLLEIARLRVTAARLQTDFTQATMKHASRMKLWEKAVADTMATKDTAASLLTTALDYSQYRSLAPGYLTPHDVADNVLRFERLVYDPETQSKFAKAWQSSLHWMRVWQITSPGFHLRNLFGGVFNNALADVDATSYTGFARTWHNFRAGKSLGKDAERWQQVTSILTPGQIGSEAVGSPEGVLAGAARYGGESTNPLKRAFGLTVGSKGVLPRVSEAAGGEVEFYLRGTLAWDTLKKGGTLDDAVAAINKFHFDYHDLSLKEQWLKQNAIPFLTWTRHNLPLQVEQILENPRTYSRFNSARKEIEDTSKADPIIPGYFADNLAIRLPFTQGGGHKYYMPDLPLRDLALAGAPLKLAFGQGDTGARFVDSFSEPLSQVTPLIAGPIEWYMQRQVFKGLPLHDDRPVPLSQLHIPKWVQRPLTLSGVIKYNKPTGKYYISERDFYLVDKLLPVYARARRLGASNEPKMRDSLMGHLISFFGGAQVRTNTVDDQKIANYLRSLDTNTSASITKRLQPGYDPSNGDTGSAPKEYKPPRITGF